MANMIVIPIEYDRQRIRLADVDDQSFPDLLRREIGAQRVDHSAFRTPWGPVQVWVGDDSLRNDSLDHNLRAIALCRDCGYDVPDVRGVAVVTIYDPTTGESVDVPEVLVEYLDGWSPGDGELARAGGNRLSSMEEIEAFMARLLHDRYA